MGRFDTQQTGVAHHLRKITHTNTHTHTHAHTHARTHTQRGKNHITI